MNQLALSETILAEANKCVLCGLCLPECPTFNETRREAQSPRGRIAFAKALAENKLTATKTLLASFAGCLQCRACEQACPSKVGFRKIIRSTQSLLIGSTSSAGFNNKSPRRLKAMARLARHPDLLVFLITLYKRSGLYWVLKKSGLLKLPGLDAMNRLLPVSTTPAIRHNKDRGHNEDKPEIRIGFFTGCLGRALDRQTLDSVQLVFEALGITLVTSDRQLCCGSLDKSASPGQTKTSDIGVFFPPDIETIVSCVSGCTAELFEDQAQSKNILDVSSFLAQQNFKNINFKPYTGTIGVHEPCSLRYPLAAQASVYKIMENIPGARIQALPENNRCCGGAGDYLLRQPAMAKKLAENKVSAMQQMHPSTPDIIVTSNLGCALNMQAAMNQQANKIEVIHPVSMLVRQLPDLA